MQDSREGYSTFWQVYEGGPRKALAIHCSLAHSGAWSGLARELSDLVTLTAFDKPGHGRSEDWRGGDYLEAVRGIAESLLPEEPVDLIGHSFGGVSALSLALRMPERVRTLTLIEPVLFAAARGTEAGAAHAAAMKPYFDHLARGDREAAARDFLGLWGTGQDWNSLEERTRAYTSARIHLIAAGYDALEGDSGDILAPGGLESLDLPVMLIEGGDAPEVISVIAESIAARLPDVGVARVPGAGHMLPITHAPEVAGLVRVNLERG